MSIRMIESLGRGKNIYSTLYRCIGLPGINGTPGICIPADPAASFHTASTVSLGLASPWIWPKYLLSHYNISAGNMRHVGITLVVTILLFLNIVPLFCLAIPQDDTCKGLSGESQSEMRAEEKTMENDTSTSFSEIDVFFQEYHTYESMVEQLRMIEGMFPDIVKLYDLTKNTEMRATYEGRSVWAVKVGKGVGSEADYYDDPDKPNVLIFGAHHGREWMSYEVCIYTLFYLAYNYGRSNVDDDGDTFINEDILDGLDNDNDGVIDEDPSQGRVNFLVENRDIWIIPMINPDGVAYDHTISTAGTGGGWRKNLRNNIPPLTDDFDPNTDGVDLNRNYPYMWWANRKGSVVDPDGVVVTQDSANPSSDMYRGPSDLNNQDGDSGTMGLIPRVDEDPVDGIDNDGDGKVDEDRDGGFSEPETQAMGALVKTFDDQPDTGNIAFTSSISYHSYAGLVLWPWGYARRTTPHDSLFKDIGNQLADITGYEGRQATDLYPASGDSEDWLYGSGNIMAFTIELDGPDGGFHPATEHIIPICRKNLAANLYLFDVADKTDVAKQYYLSLEQSVLGIEIVNKQTVARADKEIVVEVEVSHIEKMVPDSLFLHYSRDGYSYSNIEMVVDSSTGNFKATLQQIPPGTVLRYYVSAQDVSGISIRAPDYGRYDPYAMKVIDEPGLSTLENIVMLMMMFIILLIVWGGFGSLLSKAIRAEKKKNEMTG